MIQRAASARRDDVRARIIDAAALLLHEHGPAGVTTRAVAGSAGVQAPTIYRLFGDKDGLLDAVAEHVVATYVAAKADAVDAAAAADLDPVDELRHGWRTQIEFALANPTLYSFVYEPGRSSPAVKAGMRVLRTRVGRVAAAGRLRVSAERAVDAVQAAGVGTIRTLLATPPSDRDEELADLMWDAVAAQILVPASVSSSASSPSRPDARASAASAAPDPVTAAVALRAAAPGLEMLTTAERGLLVDWLDRVVAGLRAG